MLSLFPSLLSWNQLSPFLIRLVLGAIFLHWSYTRFKTPGSTGKSKAIAAVDAILGLLFLAGIWTQVAGMIAALDFVIRLIKKLRKGALLSDGVNYYLILLVLSISLVLTGAGLWAFDISL